MLIVKLKSWSFLGATSPRKIFWILQKPFSAINKVSITYDSFTYCSGVSIVNFGQVNTGWKVDFLSPGIAFQNFSIKLVEYPLNLTLILQQESRDNDKTVPENIQENVQDQTLSKNTPEGISLSEGTEECEAEKISKDIEEASNGSKEQAGAELEFLETEEKMTDSPQG